MGVKVGRAKEEVAIKSHRWIFSFEFPKKKVINADTFEYSNRIGRSADLVWRVRIPILGLKLYKEVNNEMVYDYETSNQQIVLIMVYSLMPWY